jgi:uncharacterized protein
LNARAGDAGRPPPEAGNWPCLGERPGGSVLQVSVSPNARATRAEGLHDGALRVRLAAQPQEGRANAALCAWLASQLGLPQRAVRLRRGATGRRKILELDTPPATLAAWLTGLSD